MFRSVLVPLDESPFGEHALPLALGIARRANAGLRLAHVHVPAGYVSDGGALAYDPGLDAPVRERERAYLEGVAERLRGVAPVPVTTALLDGAVADALRDHAAAAGADLVVMTTHGRGPFARFWLGSVADQLARTAPAPVLLVHPGQGPPDLAGDTAPRHVLVPLDGSPLAERALGPAAALARLTGADLTLVQVIPPAILGVGVGGTPEGVVSGLGRSLVDRLQELHGRQRTEAEAYLARVAERLRAEALTVKTRVAAHEQPAVAVLDEARVGGVDLIALATHGRGGIRRALLGSVADKLVRGAPTPVLVCHTADPETKGTP